MKSVISSIGFAFGLLGFAANCHAGEAGPVEYVGICSLYGAGFSYIPGTEVCLHRSTGDARQATEGGVWRSLLPYPEGNWVTDPAKECGLERLVTLGTFQSTDFTLNPWQRKQTPAIPLTLRSTEYVSRIIMGGGFYDPRIPARHGVNGYAQGLCVRSTDAALLEVDHNGPFNPPWGNGALPIGCVSNSRIVNMPASYAINVTSAYPSIDAGFYEAEQTFINGPVQYGRELVVTTDMGPGGEFLLTYADTSTDPITIHPLAGSLKVSVCIAQRTMGYRLN